MRARFSRIAFFVLIALALASTGCLVSGTFVVVEDFDFDFTAQGGFYWYPVDLTGNTVWEDHSEDIDDIDAIGMQFTIRNTSDVSSTLTIKIKKASGEADPNGVPPAITGATTIIGELTVPANTTRVIGYAGSLAYITNIEKIKEIILSGRFDVYGTSTGGPEEPFEVRNGKIVVTISASST